MRFGLAATLLLTVTLAVWAPSVTHGWNYEDRRYAADLIEGRVAWGVPKRLAINASWALDRALFGFQPWAFHLGSVLWHGGNAVLLLAVAWRVMPAWPALGAALVFALHPVQVEAVSYVSSRGELVAGTGILLALLAASAGSIAGALGGVLLACLAKETAIVAWGLVLVWAAWTPAAFSIRGWLLLTVPGVLGVGLVAMRYIRELQFETNLTMAGETAASMWRLLFLLPLPLGQTIDHDWAALAPYGSLALIVTVGLTCWALTDGWWARSSVALAWVWTVVALSPRFVVPLYEGLHEHHLYFAIIGWCLCAGYGLSHLRAKGTQIHG